MNNSNAMKTNYMTALTFRENTMRSGGFSAIATALVMLSLMQTASGEAGVTPGNFDVSSSGAATYSIPIFTPPGPQRVQPSIALTYNSQTGKGIAGIGWSVSGLSSIERCWPTRGQDGANGGIGFTVHDRFCLNGNRLRLVNGAPYGGPNTVYQTEFADFAEITAVGSAPSGIGPAHFVAKGKNGLTYEYGATPDSVVFPGTVTTPFRWKLNKVSDRYGNNYVVTYSKANATSHAVPETIRWTRTTSTATGPTDYTYLMRFTYIARSGSDGTFGFLNSQIVQNLNRLSSITVKYVTGSTERTIRRYALAYGIGPPDRNSLITSITECSDDSEDHCFAPTQFTYQVGSGVSATAGNITTSATPTFQGKGDFNGDQREDWVYTIGTAWYVVFGGANGFSYISRVTGLSAAASAVEIDRFLPNGRSAFLANPSGTLRTHVASDANGDGIFEFPGGVSTGISFTSGQVPVGVDYNGDGRADLQWVALEGSTRRVKLRANSTTGANPTFGAATNGHTIPTIASNGGTVTAASVSSGRGSLRLDANGDGLEDVHLRIAVRVGSITRTYQAVSLNAATLAPFANWQESQSPPVQIGNFNDDNCTDTLYLGNVVISNCTFTPGQPVALPPGASNSIKAWVDWDADGRVDLLVNDGTNIGVYRSTGSGFHQMRATTIPGNLNFSGIDIDGDNLMDLAAPDGSSVRYYLQSILDTGGEFATHIPDLLESVTDGNGLAYFPDYAVTSESNYIPGPPAVAPFRESHTLTVVARARYPDGVGGEYNKTYTYTAARDDTDRGSFLGFAQVDEVDSRGAFVTKAYYDQAFPSTGMINRREVYQSNGNLISRTTFTNSPQALDATPFNQRYFQHVSEILEETFKVSTDPAKDGQPLTSVLTTHTNLDVATGNIGRVTVKLTDNDADSPDSAQSWTKATTYEYAPANASNRCISLLQSVQADYSTGTNPPSLTRRLSITPDTANCRASQQIVESTSATYRVETTYGYDAFGNVSSTSTIGRNPDGSNMPARTTSSQWGTTGQFLVSSWNELNQQTVHDYYYDFGTLKSKTDPNNLVSNLAYDTFGRLERVTRPDGTSTSWEYSDCAPSCLNTLHKTNVTARELNANGVASTDTTNYIDQMGRTMVARSKLPDGSYQWIENRYDARGRLARQGIPCATFASTSSCVAQWLELGYDEMNRVTSTIKPVKQGTAAVQTSTMTYDGRTTRVQDTYGKTTSVMVNARGVARRTVDQNGYYQDFIYDVAGSLREVRGTDSQGTKTLFSATHDYGLIPFQTSSFEPASGTRYQTYNSLGELVEWRDANGQTFSAKYDALSRMTERAEPDNVARWIWGSNPALKNVGKLETIRFEPAGGYSEDYFYDGFGRVQQKDITIPGQGTFSYNIAYDANTGLIDTLTYPDNAGGSRLVIRHNHSPQGVLESVVNVNESTTYWTLNSLNVHGQITRDSFGNGIVREQVIDTVTGLLDSIHVGTAANPNSIQNATFSYDLLGNVTQRQNVNAFLTEDFVYGSPTDDSYRLGSSILRSGSDPAVTNLSLTYDGSGNVLTRYAPETDVMLPHSVTWNSANYPTLITTTTAGGEPIETAAFSYGPMRGRWRMRVTAPGVDETTYYIGGLLEKVVSGSNVEYRHYIQAGDETVAILSRPSSGSPTLSYVFSDHQGTVDSVLNGATSARVSQSFTAFGAPRNAATWSGAPGDTELAQMAAITRQGYTFQTVLGRMGMNHMNGRVQDAVTGRFLSPDPFVGDPSNTQAFNRYAYVYNNPLTFQDPTGFVVPLPSNIPQLPNQYPGEDRDPNWEIMRDPDYGWSGPWWNVTTVGTGSGCRTPAGGVMSEAVCGMATQIGLGSAIAASVAAQQSAPANWGTVIDRSVTPPKYETKCDTLSCHAAGWSIPDGVYDDLMGAFDAVSFGLATRISEWVHGEPVVDRNSERYQSSLQQTSIAYTVVTLGAGAVTKSIAAGGAAVVNAGGTAATAAQTTQLTSQQIVQTVARAEYAKGVAHLKTFLSAKQQAMLTNPKLAAATIGTAVHNATAAALRTLYPGRFTYSSNKGIDFYDNVAKTFTELTTRAQSLYKQAKYGIPPNQVATYK